MQRSRAALPWHIHSGTPLTGGGDGASPDDHEHGVQPPRSVKAALCATSHGGGPAARADLCGSKQRLQHIGVLEAHLHRIRKGQGRQHSALTHQRAHTHTHMHGKRG